MCGNFCLLNFSKTARWATAMYAVTYWVAACVPTLWFFVQVARSWLSLCVAPATKPEALHMNLRMSSVRTRLAVWVFDNELSSCTSARTSKLLSSPRAREWGRLDTSTWPSPKALSTFCASRWRVLLTSTYDQIFLCLWHETILCFCVFSHILVSHCSICIYAYDYRMHRYVHKLYRERLVSHLYIYILYCNNAILTCFCGYDIYKQYLYYTFIYK